MRYVDPDGRIAEISYSEKESKAKIIIPVKYSAETTESQKNYFLKVPKVCGAEILENIMLN